LPPETCSGRALAGRLPLLARSAHNNTAIEVKNPIRAIRVIMSISSVNHSLTSTFYCFGTLGVGLLQCCHIRFQVEVSQRIVSFCALHTKADFGQCLINEVTAELTWHGGTLPVSRRIGHYHDWLAEFRKGITATLRTQPWLVSGWECRGRRLPKA